MCLCAVISPAESCTDMLKLAFQQLPRLRTESGVVGRCRGVSRANSCGDLKLSYDTALGL